MKSSGARKGDHFEGQVVVPFLRDHLGPQVCRPRAGAERDLGDIAGIPDWTFQVKNFTDLMRAVRDGFPGLAAQQANARTTHGALIVKRYGKAAPERQLFVMELGAAIEVIRETARWDLMTYEESGS